MPEHPNQLTTTNLAAWQTYATEALTTETGPARPPTRLDWCQIPGIGPGAEILGDITGLRVLELGCGTGNTSAYLAAAGAPVTGVDSAAAQIQRARLRWQHPNLDFVHAEASDHLQRPGPRFDAIVSVFGALDWTSPAELLPLIARCLQPTGRLAFSTVHPAWQHRFRTHLRCPSGRLQPIQRPATEPHVWPSLLADAGLCSTSVQTIEEDDPRCVPVTAIPAS